MFFYLNLTQTVTDVTVKAGVENLAFKRCYNPNALHCDTSGKHNMPCQACHLVSPGFTAVLVLWLLGLHSGRDLQKEHLPGYGFGILVYKRPVCTAGGFHCCFLHSAVSPCCHKQRRNYTWTVIPLESSLTVACRSTQGIVLCSNILPTFSLKWYMLESTGTLWVEFGWCQDISYFCPFQNVT